MDDVLYLYYFIFCSRDPVRHSPLLCFFNFVGFISAWWARGRDRSLPMMIKCIDTLIQRTPRSKEEFRSVHDLSHGWKMAISSVPNLAV